MFYTLGSQIPNLQVLGLVLDKLEFDKPNSELNLERIFEFPTSFPNKLC
jgi:hypothetical protein